MILEDTDTLPVIHRDDPTPEPSSKPHTQNCVFTAEELDCLHDYPDNPYPPYAEENMKQLIESVRENGVLEPILVHTLDKKKQYEIISGHYRVRAARAANCDVPAVIIKDDLSANDIKRLVAETNVNQRSISELKPSVKAHIISEYYNAVKNTPQYRVEFIKAVEESVGVPVEHSIRSRDIAANKNKLSPSAVYRYIQVNKLIQPLKDRLDNGEIALRTAVALSTLSSEQQESVDNLLKGSAKLRLTMNQAEELADLSKKGELTDKEIGKVLDKDRTIHKYTSFNLKNSSLKQYFNASASKGEIEKTIEDALKFYFEHKAKHNAD